jgi:hypothetical protein
LRGCNTPGSADDRASSIPRQGLDRRLETYATTAEAALTDYGRERARNPTDRVIAARTHHSTSIPPGSKKLCQALAGLSCASKIKPTRGTMAVRLGDVLWWLGLVLGGVVWTALLALAHSAGPVDEAVFWASLIAALPIGFGYLCRYILSGRIGATADTVLDPAALPQAQNATIKNGSEPGIEPGSAQASIGRGSQRKDDAAIRGAATVKLQSGSKSPQKSRSAVARAKKGTRFS